MGEVGEVGAVPGAEERWVATATQSCHWGSLSCPDIRKVSCAVSKLWSVGGNNSLFSGALGVRRSEIMSGERGAGTQDMSVLPGGTVGPRSRALRAAASFPKSPKAPPQYPPSSGFLVLTVRSIWLSGIL